jgi:hypothetical protein
VARPVVGRYAVVSRGAGQANNGNEDRNCEQEVEAPLQASHEYRFDAAEDGKRPDGCAAFADWWLESVLG